jgi:hypothetical protein
MRLMEVVSDDSEAELARREAMLKVRWALREIAANLMRITRGAGKSWEVGRQARELVNMLVAHREACGHLPASDEITAALSIDDRHWTEELGDAAGEMLDVRDRIVRGCLQIAASELLGQNTQLAAGRSEMYEGIRDPEAIREKNRALPARHKAPSRIDVDLRRRIHEARAKGKKPRP